MVTKKDLESICCEGTENGERSLEDDNDDNTDNIEEAKRWALSQKQNFVKS